MHSLIDWNNPKCLYCRADLVYKDSHGIALFVVKVFTCSSCRESFDTSQIIGDPVSGFTFTCKDIEVHFNYERKRFGLKRGTNWSGPLIWINAFEVDFSEKDMLYNKLLTCLTFA